jgi:hypothetical protein
VVKNALVRGDQQAAGFRSIWGWYKARRPVVRIAIPFALSFACIAAAWTVLNEGEYGVALALVSLFLLFGIQAIWETAWSRGAKCVVAFVFVVIACYSGAVILRKKGDKSLTTLFTHKEDTVRVIPQPSISHRKDEVFLIHHKGAVAFGDYPQPFLYEYGVPTALLAPIGLAVNVEIINNRPTKTKVKSYVADIQTPDGKWHRILSLPMSPPRTIYYLNRRDITRGMKCEFDPANFDAIAVSTTLDLGQPLEGWMFFEYPAELRRSTVFVKTLKLSITNIQNEIAEAVFDQDKAPKPQLGESAIDSNAVWCHGKPGQRIDLSSVPIKPLWD